LERGSFRDTVPDFSSTLIQDELKYGVRNGLFEEPARKTLTRTTQETAIARAVIESAVGDYRETGTV
jgi:gluconate 2-dehydrogenase alpha chain